MMIERWASVALQKKLLANRVISVVGCRQSGKTTLLMNTPFPSSTFLSLDSKATFNEAKEDPEFFVRPKIPGVIIIDEIQKVPELIGEIKFKVDRNPAKGQYIISGSSDYRRLPQANESLAGRAGFVRIRTFSEAELRGAKPEFLKSLFEGRLPISLSFDCDKATILEAVIRGGFPEIYNETDVEVRSGWYTDYLNNQVLLDLKDQWGVRKKNTMERVLESAAIFSSKELAKSTLAKQFEVTWTTLDAYLSAIEAMYIVDIVPGWAKKDYDRAGATPKLFMTDSGLMAHLLKIRQPNDILLHPEKSQNEGGKLIETWVYNQLASELDLHSSWKIHHFRSRSHEIDFLITNESGHILAIEVKAGSVVGGDDFRHLHWMQDLVGEENFTGIILYTGNTVRSGGKNCFALPMASLWSDFSKWGNS